MTGMEQTVLINLMAELAELEEQRTQTPGRAWSAASAAAGSLRKCAVEEAADAREPRRPPGATPPGSATPSCRSGREADLARRRERLRPPGTSGRPRPCAGRSRSLEAQLDRLLEQACA